jgi:hypothetical protein
VAGFALAAAFMRWRRQQPRMLEVRPNGELRLSRAGACAAEPAVLERAFQWPSRLLAWELAVAGRRRQMLLLPADAMSAAQFHELSVFGRCAKRSFEGVRKGRR